MNRVWYNPQVLKRKIRIVVIAVLTLVLLGLFLRNSNPDRVAHLLRSVQPMWLLPGFAANLLALLCRALRWRTILRPDDPPRFYPTFFSTAIGFMSSAILPIRAGDVIRPALLSRRTDIRFSSALGTVVTERLLDLTAVVTLFLTFVVISLSRGESFGPARMVFLRSAGSVAALVFVGVVVFVAATFFFRERVRRLLGWVSRMMPMKWRGSFMNFFDAFVISLKLPNNPLALAKVLALTVCIWILLTSQFFFVVRAFGHPLPYRASFLVTAMSILGLSIPTPGGVGGFHKACQIVLVNFYAFDVDTSVAVALIFHLVGTAPVLLTGALLFAHEGLTIRQLEDIGEHPGEIHGSQGEDSLT